MRGHKEKEDLLPLLEDWLKTISIYIVLTERCNCRCSHCYIEFSERDIETDYVLRVIEGIRDVPIANVVFTGGEIFLHNGITDIIQSAFKKGLSLSIVTNGICLNHKHAKCIKETTKKLSISIDGKPETHNRIRSNQEAFSGIDNTIHLCRTWQINLSAVSTISSLNLDEIEWIVDYCLNAGIQNIRFQPASAYAGNTNTYKKGELLSDVGLEQFYSIITHLSIQYAGRANIKAVGVRNKEIDCHGCLLGLHYGLNCHRRNMPWPQVFYIDTGGVCTPFHNCISPKYSIGVVENNLRDLLVKYYGSELHLSMLDALHSAYRTKLNNSGRKYIDITNTVIEQFLD